ncbi:MAG: LamG-like jellyroll fold domain-containing protein, partial [Candidatus Micrarchaeia archaeon]
VSSGYTLPIDKWTFVTLTFGPSGVNFYVNGNMVYSSSIATSGETFTPLIGWDDGSSDYWEGDIANSQIYNTSLSANDIQALYQEGIGGAPINLQNLIGWWPLNGNANDYSGNGNNGVPSNVVFVSNWYSGYTPP